MRTTTEDAKYTQALMRRVEFVRDALGMTKVQLARRMNRDPRSFWRWLNGDNVPLARTEALMAAALGVSRSDLAPGEFVVGADGACEFVEFPFDRPFDASSRAPRVAQRETLSG